MIRWQRVARRLVIRDTAIRWLVVSAGRGGYGRFLRMRQILFIGKVMKANHWRRVYQWLQFGMHVIKKLGRAGWKQGCGVGVVASKIVGDYRGSMTTGSMVWWWDGYSHRNMISQTVTSSMTASQNEAHQAQANFAICTPCKLIQSIGQTVISSLSDEQIAVHT